jgi:hypothetical protein
MGFLILSIMWGIMGYSLYTGDTSYLNIVTIFYTLVIIVVALLIPLCSLMTYNLKILKPETVLSLQELFKKPALLREIFNIITLILTISLMILNGYIYLVVSYILLVIWVKICFASVNEALFEDRFNG